MIPPDNTARNARILELFRAGKYYSQIAAELGVSKSVVAGVCSRAGARRGPWNPKPAAKPKPPSPAERLKGIDTSVLTMPEIAALLGVKLSTIRKWLWENKIPYKRQRQGAGTHRRHVPNLGGESAPAPKPQKDPLPPRAVFGLAAVPHDPNPMGCRYIHGHAGEPGHRYCGERRISASSAYCAEHYALTHIPHSSPAERRALRTIERMGGRAA